MRLVKQARSTRRPWLVACDVNMDPDGFRKSLWLKEECVSIEAPEQGISTSRSKCSKGEAIERTYDYVIASRSLQGKIKNMEVVEDLESRPLAVTFVVERDSEIQEVREFKSPEALPDYSRGKMPGRSKAEGGKRRRRRKEEEEEEDEVRRVEKEVMKAVLTASLVDSTTSGVCGLGGRGDGWC